MLSFLQVLYLTIILIAVLSLVYVCRYFKETGKILHIWKMM